MAFLGRDSSPELRDRAPGLVVVAIVSPLAGVGVAVVGLMVSIGIEAKWRSPAEAEAMMKIAGLERRLSSPPVEDIRQQDIRRKTAESYGPLTPRR